MDDQPILAAWRSQWTIFARTKWIYLGALCVLLGLWAFRAIVAFQDPVQGGLFRWIGVDFGSYLTQARALAAGNVAALYSNVDLEPYRQTLVAYTNAASTPLDAATTPYPPLFAWLMAPFTWLAPPLAFALWTALNGAAALLLARRVALFFPADRRLLIALLVLVSLPLVFALWLGNVQILLAVPTAEAFIAFDGGDDFRAGLWLAALTLKPQYLLLLVPLLVWKRRWAALAGLTAAAGTVLGASALVAGPASISDWVGGIIEKGGPQSVVEANPAAMINWRALALDLPHFSPDASLAITIVFTALTAFLVILACRGPWRAGDRRFAGQMSLLLVGTMLVAYHSHVYGPLLLAAPLGAFLATRVPRTARRRGLDVSTQVVIGAAVLVPSIWWAVLGRSGRGSSNLLALGLVVGGILILAQLMADRVVRSEATDLLPQA